MLNPLYRELEPRSKWQKYFPKTNCNKKVLGKGYTDFGAEQMKEWATKYSWQVRELAKRLKAENLLKTLENVHQFIYKNFQYKPDYEIQHIQSPACAWKMREQGINCKGYSTIASSILQELGIEHYIRRVSYDGQNYTHVFIVVPTKQGEIIIDGTLPQFNYTTNYLTKKDLKVMPQELKYIGLNAPTGNTSDLINVIVSTLANNGVQNVDEIHKFLSALPENANINLSPFGIKFNDVVLPFVYKGIDEKTAEQTALKFYQGDKNLLNFLSNSKEIKGLNFGGSPFGGGTSFGYHFGATNPGGIGNFGVDLNLGGGNDGGSTGGGGWRDTVNTVVGAIGTLADIAINAYNTFSGQSNNNSGGNTGNNAGGNTGNNAGGYPPPYPPQHTGNNAGGNTGNNAGGYPPPYPPQPNNDKPFYKDPLIIGLGLAGITGLIYIATKHKN